MESFTPKVGERVKFYGKNDLFATLIERSGSLGLFLFDNGSKICYGIEINIKWKIGNQP